MFFEEASLTNPLRPSSTMVKSKGDKGSPCLNPFFQLEFLSWASIYKDRNQSRNKTPFNPFDPFFIKSQSTQQVIKKFSTYKIVCLLKIHSKQQTFLPLPLSLINHFISYDGPMQKISTYKECMDYHLFQKDSQFVFSKKKKNQIKMKKKYALLQS